MTDTTERCEICWYTRPDPYEDICNDCLEDLEADYADQLEQDRADYWAGRNDLYQDRDT